MENNVVHTPEEKLLDELDNMTPEDIAQHIRTLVLASRKSAKHRAAFKKGDLRALASWERELTNGYGVVKRAKKVK